MNVFYQFNADTHCWVKIDGTLRDQANLNEFINFNSPVALFLRVSGGIACN